MLSTLTINNILHQEDHPFGWFSHKIISNTGIVATATRIVELSAAERAAYFEDVNHVAEALHKAFHPQKINYGAYGDTGHHLHFHLVPKYTDEYEWGGVFAMNPQQKFLTDAEYDALISEMKKYL